METVKHTYKDSLKEEKLPFVIEVMLGRRWPWVKKVLRWTVVPIFLVILYPFRKQLSQFSGGNVGHISKLYRLKRYEEGYRFGLEQLSKYAKRRKPKKFEFNNDLLFWQIFDQTCECALEMNQFDTLLTLTQMVPMGLDTNHVQLKANVFCNLSRLAWKLNQQDAAYQWVDKAIEIDDTHAPAYILKGWYDAVLEKGQPLEDIFHGIQIDPSLKESVFADQVFIDKAPLLEDLERKLAEAKNG
jgi:hypothetical protein